MKLIYLVLILAIASAGALAIGVSPSTLHAANMARGQSYDAVVRLSGLGASQITVESSGKAADWVSWEWIGEAVSDTRPAHIKVNVPQDAPNGDYSVMLVFRENPEVIAGDSARMSVKAGVSLRVQIEVTGKQVRQYSIASVSVLGSEEGQELPIVLSIVNTGNVEAGPESIQVKAYSISDKVLLAQANASFRGAIPPHSTGKLTAAAALSLDAGEYLLELRVFDNSLEVKEKEQMIQVYPKGTMAKRGDLVSLDVRDARLGDTCRIEAQFENTGEILVGAVFVGEIYHGARLLEVVKSDEGEVFPGETRGLTAYFLPDEPGKYSVVGHVVYESKQTEDKSGRFTVAGPVSSIALIAVVVTILALAAIIWYKRK